MFAGSVISVRGGCNKCSRDNTWNKQPATDQSDYSIEVWYNYYLTREKGFLYNAHDACGASIRVSTKSYKLVINSW